MPLNAFYESIYENEYAGNVVKFSGLDDSPLIAARIWDSCVNPKNKELSHGFAIITRNPMQFIGNAGHDRRPILMHKEFFNDWLDPSNNGNEENILSILKAQKR